MKVAQLCLTLCDPQDYTVRGILQARILEKVAFSIWVVFILARVKISRGSSQPRDGTRVSRIPGGFFTNQAIREACHLLLSVN